MKVCRALKERLDAFCEAHGASMDDLWGTLIYEVPDEVLQDYAAMADPVDIQVSQELEDVTEGMAEAFGMTVLGMSVLMNDVMTKALEVDKRKKDYESSRTA